MKHHDCFRKWSAWALIWVFVPMLVLSAFHTHGETIVPAEECQECMHHVHHSHFATADLCVDNCVLCQFQLLTFIAVETLVLANILHATRFSHGMPEAEPTLFLIGCQSGRAPPTLGCFFE